MSVDPIREAVARAIAGSDHPMGSAEQADEVIAAYEAAATVARPLSEWHEDMGDVVWWFFPMTEAPWIGSPIEMGHTVEVHTHDSAEGPRMASRFHIGGWPGHHTHWTPLPSLPAPPAKVVEADNA